MKLSNPNEMTADTVLEVKNLHTSFSTEKGEVEVVQNVSFTLRAGKTLGIVGESGCGKSVTALSLLGLLPRPMGKMTAGKVLLKGQEFVSTMRGNRMTMIFQEPMTALNPVQRVGAQLAECFQLHFKAMDKHDIKRASIKLLQDVGISLPEKRLREYPHQMSGGMRQRVMIAMALATRPDVLIADEPTTALDVTIQAQILRLIKEIQEDKGMAMIFITHDLGVIAEVSDEVMVMYCGQMVEQGNVEDIFNNPLHPYTQGLLASIPRLDGNPRTLLKTIEGLVPDLGAWPLGCRFSNRCPYAKGKCYEKDIPLVQMGEEKKDHLVRCLLFSEGKKHE